MRTAPLSDVSFASHPDPSGWQRPRTDRSNDAPPQTNGCRSGSSLRAWRMSPTIAITGDEAHGSLYSFCPTVLRDFSSTLTAGGPSRESTRCRPDDLWDGWLVSSHWMVDGRWPPASIEESESSGQARQERSAVLKSRADCYRMPGASDDVPPRAGGSKDVSRNSALRAHL
jgi:hypothetical protein